MNAVGIFEAKNRFSELVERAMGGEEIVITRRGEQVARLMPPRATDALGAARSLAARIRTSRGSLADTSSTVQPSGGDVSTLGSIREMVEEGRR
jgi:prevent-host-death family protein